MGEKKIFQSLKEKGEKWLKKMSFSKAKKTQEWEANILFKRAKKKVFLPAEDLISKKSTLKDQISKDQKNKDLKTAANSPQATMLTTRTIKDKKITPQSHIQVQPIMMTLYITPKETEGFQGAELQQFFELNHLHYGEMKIYHYHENQDGTGDALFSLASMVEPGTFDIGDMPAFSTPGLSLFCFISNAAGSQQFEAMISIARKLAKNLGAELKSAQHTPLTERIIEQEREKIKELSLPK